MNFAAQLNAEEKEHRWSMIALAVQILPLFLF
jgi:hypothetical protein